jgi:glycosyltransferase involved in cell wall biosynthesis
MKKKILFLRRTFEVGGAEAILLDLFRRIDYEKNEVCLVCSTDVFSKSIESLGRPVKYIPSFPCTTGGFWNRFTQWGTFLRGIRPNKIIFAKGGFYDFSLPSVLAGWKVACGNLYLMELHPAPPPPAKTSRLHFGGVRGLGLWWYKIMWQLQSMAFLSRRVLATSIGIKNSVLAYGYPSGKVHVVYPGIDALRFSDASPDERAALRADFGIPANATVIVSTARLSTVKRLERLIKAFASLHPSRSDLWMLLTGDGPLRENVQALAKTVHTEGRIKFLGYVDDVGRPLRASDIYVLPSDEEGFGIAVIEAMATKLICVSTKTLGPCEFIEDGKNGFLVDLTEEGVLHGLERALSLSRAEKQMMADNARAMVVKNFVLSKSVEDMLTILDIEYV